MLLAQTCLTVLVAALFLGVLLNLSVYRRIEAVGVGEASAPSAGTRARLSILVPARDEAARIADCLEGLLRGAGPADEILVLDDHSRDATAAIVAEMAALDRRLHLLNGRPLPAGWAGKAHACAQLAEAARGEWLLFVDADTRSEPVLPRMAVTAAERLGADLVSTFPRQEMGSFGEEILVPMIFVVLCCFLPLPLIWRSRRPAFAAACGQFLLARRSAYEAAGGHGAIRGSLHDGLDLARVFKRSRLRVCLLDATDQIRCRMYHGGREAWQGFSRNVYAGIGSPGALSLLSAGELLLLLPFLFLPFGLLFGTEWLSLCAVQVALVLGIRLALLLRFRQPLRVALWHPLAMLALLAIQWTSFGRSFLGGSVEWKGRVYRPGAARP